MKTALITGITGQDGMHLTKLLLGLDYRVVGICRDAQSMKAVNFGLMFPGVKVHTRPTETEKILRVATACAASCIKNWEAAMSKVPITSAVSKTYLLM